jgi:hypothetical protein
MEKMVHYFFVFVHYVYIFTVPVCLCAMFMRYGKDKPQ